MQIREGKGVYGGVAIGRIAFFKREAVDIRRQTVEDSEREVTRYLNARQKTLDELHTLYDKALKDIGSDEAQIFEIHGMMVEDEDFNDAILTTIRSEKVNAEYAVSVARDNFSTMFSSMEDPYMNARAADVKDISQRILQAFSEKDVDAFEEAEEEGQIIYADDLAPSETMQLDKNRVLAFVTSHGSVSSHTAILARTMGIPAVVGIGDPLPAEADGLLAVIDGFTGMVYLDPDEKTVQAMKKKQAADLHSKALLQRYKGMDNVTRDGRRIDVFANIQGPKEVGSALLNDAGGIGLMRSEFLFLERETFPTEEEQFESYKSVLQSMGSKKVVIRTLDIGADKQIGYFDLGKEDNPAMGMRAIRICLTRPEIFKTQLRALYRASVYGNLAIMFPMIISVEEVTDILKIVDSVKADLRANNLPFSDEVETGIMIETPAAALISDELAPLVDFFSVGTNDLSQYTMAIDRQNQALSDFFNPHHKAVLKLIQIAADNAHAHGKWIGICGELGADPTLTETFLRMGIDELSVSPAYVLKLRDRICNTDLSRSENGNQGASGAGI